MPKTEGEFAKQNTATANEIPAFNAGKPSMSFTGGKKSVRGAAIFANPAELFSVQEWYYTPRGPWRF